MLICPYKECLSTKDPIYRKNGIHTEELCSECLRHIRFVPKKEVERLKLKLLLSNKELF